MSFFDDIEYQKRGDKEGWYAPPGMHWYRSDCKCESCCDQRKTITIPYSVVQDHAKAADKKRKMGRPKFKRSR